MAILPKMLTFVKFSGESSENVINTTIIFANALWEMM